MPSPEFVLSTLHPTSLALTSNGNAVANNNNNTASSSSSSTSSPASAFLPRARFCIYRGMWTELPANKHNDAPRNPAAYASDLPTFTTDVRMDKVPELFATGPGKGKPEQATGSGGGGPYEAVFWIKDVGVQWRIRGVGFVVGNDIEGGGDGSGGKEGEVGSEESSGVRTVKSEVGRRLRVLDESKVAGWSWRRELTGHFGNCSPGMRGSWRNPPPGTPADHEPDAEHKLGQKVEDLDDPIARANFRVVVLRPDEVEKTDLSDPAKARRTRYTFVEEEGDGGDGKGQAKGRWEEVELWP